MELAARQTKGGGYVDKNRNFYIILFSCCVFFLLLRGENMANGGREKAPAQNTGWSGRGWLPRHIFRDGN